VIAPGSFKPFGVRRARKRTLAYTPWRRRRSRGQAKPVARSAGAVNHEIVLFDHGPCEFPVAVVVPHDSRSQLQTLAGDLRTWLTTQWRWLRPRTVPLIVAALGMVAVLGSADYLRHEHAHRRAQVDAVMLRTGAPPPRAVVRIFK